MTKVVPNIISPPNPVGADRVVKIFQDMLAGLTYKDAADNDLNWFDGHIFGLAEKDEETEKPILYWQGKDYFSMFPNDNYKSYAFFYLEDPLNFQSQSRERYNINLIVYFNQELYSRNLHYKIREYFRNAVILGLTKTLELDDIETISSYLETDSIFRDYRMDNINNILKAPNHAFRINFQFTDYIDCGPESVFVA